MKKSIVYQGQIISFSVEYKRVKNINLRVKSDLSVAVSASKDVRDEELERLLRQKAPWILKAQEKIRERLAEKSLTRLQNSYTHGGQVAFLGKYIRLYFACSGEQRVVFQDEALWVYGYDECLVPEALIQDFYIAKCGEIVAELHDKVYPIFAAYGLSKAKITLKKLTGSWGRCHTKGQLIILNWQLIKAPLACLEAVLIHEYCHFLHPNHGKGFYQLFGQLVPNHQALKKQVEALVNLKE